MLILNNNSFHSQTSHRGVIYTGNIDSMLQDESSPDSAAIIQMELYEIKWDYLYSNPVKSRLKNVCLRHQYRCI